MRKLSDHWRSRVASRVDDFAGGGALPASDSFSSFDRPLRRGDSGYRVYLLQQRLRWAGEGFLSDTWNFDEYTEQAVRSFQRYNSLPVTGEADGRLMRALADKVGWERAEAEAGLIRTFVPTWNGHHSGSKIAHHPAEISGMSGSGKELLLFNETGGDYEATAYLHWPQNEASGVTLGVGYDMGDRDEETVKDDLARVGVDPKVASAVASVARRHKGLEAKNVVTAFGRNGREGSLIKLTYDQQMKLMILILPRYERTVKLSVTELLLQCEFDALVSFAYDPGRCFPQVASFLNQGRIGAGLRRWYGCTGGGSVRRGLQARRRRELEFFLTGRFSRA